MIIRAGIGLLVMGLYIFFFALFHRIERSNIAEIGYRRRNKRNPAPPSTRTILDTILHWNLCKNARFDRNVVWFYFGLNLFSLICLAVAIIIYIVVVIFCNSLYEVIVYQLGFLMLYITIWGILHFVIDIFFLPSERKRYGISDRKRKK